MLSLTVMLVVFLMVMLVVFLMVMLALICVILSLQVVLSLLRIPVGPGMAEVIALPNTPLVQFVSFLNSTLALISTPVIIPTATG
jgi:hypothetical protein